MSEIELDVKNLVSGFAALCEQANTNSWAPLLSFPLQVQQGQYKFMSAPCVPTPVHLLSVLIVILLLSSFRISI